MTYSAHIKPDGRVIQRQVCADFRSYDRHKRFSTAFRQPLIYLYSIFAVNFSLLETLQVFNAYDDRTRTRGKKLKARRPKPVRDLN